MKLFKQTHRQLLKSLCLGLFMIACGSERPEYEPSTPSSSSSRETSETQKQTPATSNRTPSPQTQRTADTKAPAPEADMPAANDPVAPPASAPVKLALRTVPNAAEKAEMQALYNSTNANGGCVGCHGALDVSERKGATAAQLTASATIINHRTPAAANKWPRDMADTTDDGVDTAQLKASALAELLK